MPKLKTIKSAAKRFKKTGTGKFIHKSSHRRHLLTKKSTKRKRHLRGNPLVDKRDHHLIKQMLPE